MGKSQKPQLSVTFDEQVIETGSIVMEELLNGPVNLVDIVGESIKLSGEMIRDLRTGKTGEIRIYRIERMAKAEIAPTDLSSFDHREANSFWHSPSLDELIEKQQVEPVRDVSTLFGTWPDDEDDGFEASVDALRHAQVS